MSGAANPALATEDSRFGWLDFAKGLCILSVVWMWADKQLHLETGWFHDYARFSLPFRMPDFFLISGLLMGRVINRPWRNFLDTRVVHYLYFLVVWSFVYVPITWVAHAPAGATDAVWQIFYKMIAAPEGNLWFVQMLACYFLVTRLCRKVPPVLMVLGALFLYWEGLPVSVYAIELFGNHFIFFYAGYIGAPLILRASQWIAQNRTTAVVALLAWAIGNYFIMVLMDLRLGPHPIMGLILRFMGIAGVITFSTLVWRASPARLVNYMGRNSLVLYLGFFIPLMLFVELTALKGINVQNSTAAIGIWTVCVVFSFALYWVARRTPLKYLYERPSWVRIPASGTRAAERTLDLPPESAVPALKAAIRGDDPAVARGQQ